MIAACPPSRAVDGCRPRHGTGWWPALLILLPISVAAHAASEFTVHPACFEPLLGASNADPGPETIDLADCSRRHRGQPVTELRGLTRYERPGGDAGERRGTLGYERIRGRGDRVLYRLEANAGGTGVFSALVTGRERPTADGRRLTDIRTTALGDRCHLGTKWVGRDADGRMVAAVSLTPAALVYVLAAPDSRVADSELDRQRARYAFGDRLLAANPSACPTCCTGEAIYAWSPPGGWRLQAIELDDPAPFAEPGTQALQHHLREHAERTDAGYRWSAASIAAVRRALVAAHPDPTDTRRLQHALHELGYYWLSPVDGIAGPRTEAALRAYQRDHVASEPKALAALDRHAASELVLAALQYDGLRLHPVDETGRDPGFAAFARALAEAIADRDSGAVVALSAADIMLGFGGSGGHADLREWLDHPGMRDAAWAQLAELIALGAVRTGEDAFCLPWPGCLPAHVIPDHDPFATVIVTAEDARLLPRPDPDAGPIRALDFDVLRLAGRAGEQSSRYYRVRDATGQTGFVAREDARFMIDTRMQVLREGTGWRIESIVSGD